MELIEKGKQSIKDNELTQAKSHYEEAMTLIADMTCYPNEISQIFFNLGMLYFQLNEKEKALEELKKLLHIETKNLSFEENIKLYETIAAIYVSRPGEEKESLVYLEKELSDSLRFG